jgi:hypothetical protein
MQKKTIDKTDQTEATQDRLFELSTRLSDLFSTHEDTPIIMFCPCDSATTGANPQLSILFESPEFRLFLTPDHQGKAWATIDRADCRPTAIAIDLAGNLDQLAHGLANRAMKAMK